MTSLSKTDSMFLAEAIALAQNGEGYVEPNPMVGAIVVKNGEALAKGWHHAFGMPHAEIDALQQAGNAARGATMYVSLEPCCHTGKTPPCTEAILQAGIAKVVVAHKDPFPKVAGGGLRQLREAGLEVVLDEQNQKAKQLLAPYLKRLRTGKPWVIAKWAMTLDGKIATRTGSSQWISGPASRERVHTLRGRVDAILVGRRTAEADDPLLTARPAGPRTAVRVVVDSNASLSLESQLVQTAQETPLLVAVSANASKVKCEALVLTGAEVLQLAGITHEERLNALLLELGNRSMTNVLVEGGSKLLGTLFDTKEIDEVHAFIAPKLIGGKGAITPISGGGMNTMSEALAIEYPVWKIVGSDIYLHGRITKE